MLGPHGRGGACCAILLAFHGVVSGIPWTPREFIGVNTMQSSRVRISRVALFLAAAAFVLAGGVGVAQAKKSKSIKTEATFLSYDADEKTIEVKVKKKGKKPSNKKLKLKTGKKATFNVKPEGSVLTRTSVTLDGKRADINSMEKGQFLFIYWVPDEKDPEARFARKIDMVLSEAEMDARNKARLEAAREAGQLSD
jgi:hypothetical protein